MNGSRPTFSSPWTNFALVLVFGAAMGLLEAICVIYLRQLVLPVGMEVPANAPIDRYPIEIWREACTIVMLGVVGWLAARTLVTRFGMFVAAFGVWDILYYVGLYVWAGWPSSIMEWDCLFLIPCEWWGPVLAPVLISLSFVATCVALIVADEAGRPIRPTPWRIVLLSIGWTIWLASFIVPGYGLARHPDSYPWWALILGMFPALAATAPLGGRPAAAEEQSACPA